MPVFIMSRGAEQEDWWCSLGKLHLLAGVERGAAKQSWFPHCAKCALVINSSRNTFSILL